jgi:hypothetical protein
MASHWTSTASSRPGAWWGKSHPSSLPASCSFPAFIERTLSYLTIRPSISSLARQREEKRWLRRQKVSLVSSGTMIGLPIEISLIATFTQRYFGK